MKFLKNSKYYFFALLASCMIACSDDDNNGDPDDTGDYTDSPLTPDQNKAKLEEIGKNFVAKINAADHKIVTTSLYDLYNVLDGSNFEDLVPQNSQKNMSSFKSIQLLSQVIEHNDANALMQFATRSFENEYRISDYAGIYTYNKTSKSWSRTNATNKLELHNGNTVLSVVCEGVKEYTKIDQTLIEVPATTTVTLTVDNQKLMNVLTKINLSSDMYAADIECNLVLTDNYVWTVTASATSEIAKTSFKMVIKDEELIHGTAELTGNKMTDPDYIDINGNEVFNTGNFDFQAMNVRIKGEGNIKTIIKGEDDIEEENIYTNDYSEAKDKANAETLRDLYNNNLKIEGFYVQEKQKFASIKTKLISQDVTFWIDYDENYQPIYRTVRDWDTGSILVFTDKSEMDFDSFFTEARFSGLVSSVSTLFNKYLDMVGKEHVKF